MKGEASLAALCAAMGGKRRQGDLSGGFSGASVDTRTLKRGAIFFAVRGRNTDGHRFLGAARRAGASAAVVERRAVAPSGFPVIEVASSVRALQRGGAWYRRRFLLPVIGLTGSNGKTTVKDLTAWTLDKALGMRVLATKANLNNQLGVPLTLLGLTAKARAAVLEMGMNRPGEMKKLAYMAAPTVGVVLNAGPAHVWRFRNLRTIAREKALLLEALPAGGWAILNAEDGNVWRTRTLTDARVFGFGLRHGDVRAESLRVDRMGRARFQLCTPSGKAQVRLSLPGRHNASNAAAAAAVAWVMGADPARIAGAMEAFRNQPAMRMEMGHLRNGSIGVMDCYNANPDSCRAAFSFLKDVRAKRPVLIVGEMLELGKHSVREHRAIGRLAAGLRPSLLVGIGRQAEALVDAARRAGVRDARWAARAADSYALVRDAMDQGRIVLFKGSRKVGVETVAEKLGFRPDAVPGGKVG